MRPGKKEAFGAGSPARGSAAFGWVDLAVVPLVAVLAGPTLLWFGDQPWTVLGKDSPRYLFAGSELVSGGGFDSLAGLSDYNGGHGPVLPALIGALILLLGRDTESLLWAMRLTALLNPLLAYFLAKRLSGPPAGLLAAALLTLFGFNVRSTFVINIDSLLLTFTLLAFLALLAAVERGAPVLAPVSGVLLGLSVLVKETAVANLPLALLAVLLLGWSPRAALWHYGGVALVCLPWWGWRWSATGEVYLVDRLPPSLELPVLVTAATLFGLTVAAYASGTVDRFLAGERRRRWAGRLVAGLWTVALSVLMLATTGPALAEASPEAARAYLAGVLEPAAAVVPVLLATAGYATWRAFGRDGPWKLLALGLLFQGPICLFLVVMGWDPRQFLVAQALLISALGSLVADAAGAAWRGGGYGARAAGAAVALPVTVLLLAAAVGEVRAMVPEDPAGALNKEHRIAPQASGMIGWTNRHVPGGERILVNAAQGNYLAYLDGGRHEWTFLELDQEPCVPKPNLQTGCDPDEGAISGIPPDAVWVQAKGGCEVISLSMPNLLAQARRTGYVMVTGSPKFPGLLGLPALLQRSGAFEVVRAEGGRTAQGVVLLKTTGRPPEPVPTLMTDGTVSDLGGCGPAQARGSSAWLRSEFPHGILRVTVSNP